MREHFHVHINDFGGEPPQAIRTLHREGKFSMVFCEILSKDSWEPLTIATSKFSTKTESAGAFEEALDVLRKDTEAVGYVEHESLRSGERMRLSETEYDYSMPFPLPSPVLVKSSRAADIHVFRLGDAPYDRLETRLLDSGFYPVRAPGQRILTALYESAEDAAFDFHALSEHLKKYGGANRIEMERILALETVTSDFELRKVIKTRPTPLDNGFPDLVVAGRP